ncbi:hypothetical protein DKP78_15845 [Enterococcus faecium]|nr:hypothetical protein DKP78_15845 [Enterococcus faecium]
MVRLNDLEQAARVTEWSDLSASDQQYTAKWRKTVNEIQLINPFTAQSWGRKSKVKHTSYVKKDALGFFILFLSLCDVSL